MMDRALILLPVILLFTACHRGPAGPRFAIELSSPAAAAGDSPTRVMVPDGLGSDSQIPFTALTPVSPRAEHPAGWEGLDLNYTTEGDKVKVTVFATHQEYDARRHATVFRSQKLGSHTARIQESINLAELEKLGYRPFTLRVVPPVKAGR